MTVSKKYKENNRRPDKLLSTTNAEVKLSTSIRLEHDAIRVSHSSSMPPASPVSIDGDDDQPNENFNDDLNIHRDPFVVINMVLLLSISLFWWFNDGTISIHIPRPLNFFRPFDYFSSKIRQNPHSEGIPLSYGSAIRISHVISQGYELETRNIKIGGGSGQAAVTFTPPGEGSLWLIKSYNGQAHIPSGLTSVTCGSKIRLEHTGSTKNLHTHNFKSPISGNQEVSAYGDDRGEGDDNDNWIVECEGKYWVKGGIFQLRNEVTGVYLSSSPEHNFNSRNGCGNGCPVSGHLEACAVRKPHSGTQFQAKVGIFLSNNL